MFSGISVVNNVNSVQGSGNSIENLKKRIESIYSGATGFFLLSDPAYMTQGMGKPMTGGDGDKVGLWMDLSKGLARSQNVVVNGTFVDTSNWTVNTGWAVANNKATHSSGTGTLVSTTALIAATTYDVSFTVTDVTAGSLSVAIGGNTYYTTITSNGVYNFILRASSTVGIVFTPSTDFNGSVSNVSIKVISGTHIAQNTDASRPYTYQRGVYFAPNGEPIIPGSSTLRDTPSSINPALNIGATDRTLGLAIDIYATPSASRNVFGDTTAPTASRITVLTSGLYQYSDSSVEATTGTAVSTILRDPCIVIGKTTYPTVGITVNKDTTVTATIAGGTALQESIMSTLGVAAVDSGFKANIFGAFVINRALNTEELASIYALYSKYTGIA